MEEIKLEDCPKEIQEKILSSDLEIRSSFVGDCDLKYLPLLINDKYWKVRNKVAWRIDLPYLLRFVNDSEECNRDVVKIRLKKLDLSKEQINNITNDQSLIRWKFIRDCDIKYLPLFINDTDPVNRYRLADRIDTSYLPFIINDENASVRRIIAERIHFSHLYLMVNDKNVGVQKIIKQRVLESIKIENCPEDVRNIIWKGTNFERKKFVQTCEIEYLPFFINDKLWSVREIVACRIDYIYLFQMSKEKNKFVLNAIKNRQTKYTIIKHKCQICNKQKE